MAVDCLLSILGAHGLLKTDAAKAAIGDGNLPEWVFISHLLTDADEPSTIADGFLNRPNDRRPKS